MTAQLVEGKFLAAISDIKIGERYREPEAEDDRAFQKLVTSIDSVGLLHPVVLTPNHELIAGYRRVCAVRALGYDEIEATIAHDVSDASMKLQAELDENVCRRDLRPGEAAKLRKAIAALLKPLADERMKNGKRDPSTNLVEGRSGRETRNVAAKGTGYSGSTLDKVDEVTELAEDESQPAHVRDVARQALEEMNQTGKVDGAFRKAKAAAESTQHETPADKDGTPKCTPLPDVYGQDVSELTNVVGRITKAHNYGRFPQHRDTIRIRYLSDLRRAHVALQVAIVS